MSATPTATAPPTSNVSQGTGQRLYERARRIIPGGTQLLSKRPEMFLPEQWPAYYNRAEGARVWDLDGREYLDCTIFGVGSTVLGFADPDVNEAVVKAVRAGSMTTLNCPEEVELAELLVDLHPWSDMARFARGGGEVVALAVRVARAATRRDVVAFCGYHGWHDWYLAANLSGDGNLDGHLLPGLSPLGVPRGLRDSMVPFQYNDIEALRSIVETHGDRLAAIIMEPTRGVGPKEGFLEGVRQLADESGAVLIFDEITSGWRVNSGGIHLTLGVDPDMAVFAKALGNGYPISAVIGKRDIMQAAQGTFISSTFFTERVGPTAALATIRKHIDRDVPSHLKEVGSRVQEGWRSAADAADLSIRTTGVLPLSTLGFEVSDPVASTTLFIQEMLDRGILASTQFYASYAHQPADVDRYVEGVHEAFRVVADAEASEGGATARLRGPVKHTGFKRLTG